MKIKRNKSFLFIPVFLFITLSLIACGSGSDSGSDAVPSPVHTSEAGSVAILFTDLPSDTFSKVNITITAIELFSDHMKTTVFSGNKTINLLDLKNETTLFSIEDNIPVRYYNKIRLTVTNIELIDFDGKPVSPPVKLPGNGKIDLNPQKPFYVSPGEMLTIQLDLDAEKSIKLDKNRNRYIFRPVVFIDIVGDYPPDRLMRVTGIVRNIDREHKIFSLCPDENNAESYKGASSHDDTDQCCITVYVSHSTSFFNSEEQGNPVHWEDLREGSSATIIGFPDVSGSNNDGIKKWYMGVDAIVVESGKFLKLRGTILSDVASDVDQFEFRIDPDQEVASGDTVTVQLQAGTKIYSQTGVALDASSIVAHTNAEIDGILLVDVLPHVLNAAFISLGADIIPVGKLSGTIDNIDDRSRTFDLITTSETACVEVSDNAQIFLITSNTHLESRMIHFTELHNGEQVDLYGSSNSVSGCFAADTVIAFGHVVHADVFFTTDLNEWRAIVSGEELFTTGAGNIALADEITASPATDAQLGSLLTFKSMSTGLTSSFIVETLQSGAGFTFSDVESGLPVTNFDNALSVGDADDFSDDDWRLRLLDGAGMMAFGFELRHSLSSPEESIVLYSGGEPIGTIDLSSLPRTFHANLFIGITSDVPFDRLDFNEDHDGDDIAIADFRFGDIIP